jgi:cytochrome c biogenesis protein CcmG/thiol:disulfide interchange protein DsbE
MAKSSVTQETPAAPTAHRPRLNRRALAMAIATLILLLGGGFVWLLFQPASGQVVAPGVPTGAVAPNFTLRSPQGQSYTLSALRGHPVVLNFWASYCEPCRQEAPLLDQTYRSYHSAGLVMLGINQQEDMGTIRQFGAEYGIPYPLLFDGTMKVGNVYGATPLPRTYFLDTHGIVRYVSIGELSPQTLQQGLHAIGL